MKIRFMLAVCGLFLVEACDSGSPVKNGTSIEVIQAQVSECGGFKPESKSYESGTNEAEAITWTYDAQAGILRVVNSHVNLNCCGERKISMSREGKTLVISENDQPGEKGRCRCMCYFDFLIEIGGIPPGELLLRLDSTVDSTTITKWSGSLDLTPGDGEITDLKTVQ
jgi:hypothetical protein